MLGVAPRLLRRAFQVTRVLAHSYLWCRVLIQTPRQDVVSGHKCPGFRLRPLFANSRGSTLGVCGRQRAERPAGTAPGPRQVGSRDRWHWGVGLVRQEELPAPECMQRKPVTFEDEC